MYSLADIDKMIMPYVERQEYAACESFLIAEIKETPSNELLFALAKIQYIFLGKTILAEKTFHELVNTLSQHSESTHYLIAEIQYCLAELYFFLFRDQEALNLYNSLMKIGPLPRAHRCHFIRILIRTNKLEEARLEAHSLASTEKALSFDSFLLLLKTTLKSKRLTEALEYTNKAFSIFQNGDKKFYAQIAEEFSTNGHYEIAKQLMSKALQNQADRAHSVTYANKALFYRLPDLYRNFCQHRHDYIDTTGIKKTDKFEPGELIEMYCVAFGQAHIKMLETAAIPTLFLNDGFNELLHERKVIFNIYTTADDLKHFGNILNMLTEKKIGFRINLILLDRVIDPVYYGGPLQLCGLTLLNQIRSSIEHKSIVVAILPDLLFVGGSLKKVIDCMKYKDYVVCKAPRISREAALSFIENHYKTTHAKLDVNDFIKRCMKDFIHPQTEVGFNSHNHLITIEKAPNGYQAYVAAPTPLCFYGQEKMIERMIHNPSSGHNVFGSFFCIDNDFIDMAYKDNELVIIKDSDDFFWAELTSIHTHPVHSFFQGWIQTHASYYPESYKFCRSQSNLWRCK